MRTALYWFACQAHRVLKVLQRRPPRVGGIRFVDIREEDLDAAGRVRVEGLRHSRWTTDAEGRLPSDQLYPVENPVPEGSNPHLAESFQRRRKSRASGGGEPFTPDAWRAFVDSGGIPSGYRNGGLKYAGFIGSGRDSWCLPSWIWTTAASVRFHSDAGDTAEAVRMADLLLGKQEECGGWIVRSDYGPEGEIPVLAPNDSAYIANNALLHVHRATGNEKYLKAALRCADWILESARPDGLVWTGCDANTGEWLRRYTIVDTGFTAGLFSELYMLTEKEEYRRFLERFVARFVELFWDPETALFATTVDLDERRIGGHFARGQAWALEGLIPACAALGPPAWERVVQANVESLLRAQLPNGGWAYNISRAYFGEDGKGVPVIAKALMRWHGRRPDARLVESARRALKWCEKRTRLRGPARGGIFSYNLEGAVVHNFYTSTAFVYASAYALETRDLVHASEPSPSDRVREGGPAASGESV